MSSRTIAFVTFGFGAGLQTLKARNALSIYCPIAPKLLCLEPPGVDEIEHPLDANPQPLARLPGGQELLLLSHAIKYSTARRCFFFPFPAGNHILTPIPHFTILELDYLKSPEPLPGLGT
jgi:hypothetical protein